VTETIRFGGPGGRRALNRGSARTVAEIGMHQHDAETIMSKLQEIETAQQQRR